MINTKRFFPENRFRHCHNVGLKMYQYAKIKLNWEESRCQDMYMLGTLHDIGYELNPDPFLHDVALYNVIGSSGYKYAEEIRNHSIYQDTYDTPEMRLLYFADMTVDGAGNWCTVAERLEDIELRHGKDSEVYAESQKIADKLIEWGFDDELPCSMFVSKINEGK